MAPGDVDNVAVNLNNTGTLASLAGMTLWVAGSPVNAADRRHRRRRGPGRHHHPVLGGLERGRHVRRLDHLDPGPDHGRDHEQRRARPWRCRTSPRLAASTGQVAHLQVSLTLIGTETSTNGVAPSPTVQGLTTTLTYTFTEQQRAAVTTNQ